MNRRELIKEIRKQARQRGLEFELDRKKGKGSHYLVRVGARKTTVPKRITPKLAAVIRRQLGLED